MTPNLSTFCDNWIAKANQYNNEQLSDHFDRFMSLYIVFNALYMEIWQLMGIAGKAVPKDFKDRIASTDYVIQYLKSRHFIDRLLNDEISLAKYQAIIEIAAEHRFNIVLEWGHPKHVLDEALSADLTSDSVAKKAKALLLTFYHIRCNMFHGHKGFEDRQIELLEPINYLLQKTVTIIIEKMRMP